MPSWPSPCQALEIRPTDSFVQRETLRSKSGNSSPKALVSSDRPSPRMCAHRPSLPARHTQTCCVCQADPCQTRGARRSPPSPPLHVWACPRRPDHPRARASRPESGASSLNQALGRRRERRRAAVRGMTTTNRRHAPASATRRAPCRCRCTKRAPTRRPAPCARARAQRVANGKYHFWKEMPCAGFSTTRHLDISPGRRGTDTTGRAWRAQDEAGDAKPSGGPKALAAPHAAASPLAAAIPLAPANPSGAGASWAAASLWVAAIPRVAPIPWASARPWPAATPLGCGDIIAPGGAIGCDITMRYNERSHGLRRSVWDVAIELVAASPWAASASPWGVTIPWPMATAPSIAQDTCLS